MCCIKVDGMQRTYKLMHMHSIPKVFFLAFINISSKAHIHEITNPDLHFYTYNEYMPTSIYWEHSYVYVLHDVCIYRSIWNWCGQTKSSCLPTSIPWEHMELMWADNLTWSAHINSICFHAKKILGLIYRRFYSSANQDTLRQLYISLVRPHLEYSLGPSPCQR